MTNIRRHFDIGNTYFLTHVTHGRAPILVEHASLLWLAIEKHQRRNGLRLIAWVILPDHFHILADPKDHDLSNLMRQIKLSFSTSLRGYLGLKTGRVWQHRFWDHVIRDQNDLNRHLDYIHYNPVKHGLTDNPFLWPHSSLRQYADDGYYQRDWGVRFKPEFDNEYGE